MQRGFPPLRAPTSMVSPSPSPGMKPCHLAGSSASASASSCCAPALISTCAPIRLLPVPGPPHRRSDHLQCWPAYLQEARAACSPACTSLRMNGVLFNVWQLGLATQVNVISYLACKAPTLEAAAPDSCHGHDFHTYFNDTNYLPALRSCRTVEAARLCTIDTEMLTSEWIEPSPGLLQHSR